MYSEETVSYDKSGFCPLCHNPAYSTGDDRELTWMIVCDLCGKFRLSSSAFDYLESVSFQQNSRRYKASYVTRTRSERARGRKDNSLFPIYSAEDFKGWVETPDPSVNEKLNMLLTYLAALSTYPGETLEFDVSNDFTMLCAMNAKEAGFYLDSLAEQNLLRIESPFSGRFVPRIRILANGWKQIEQLQRSNNNSLNAFIAMWFDSTRTPFEAAINKAVMASGYRPIRIDRIEHINRIDDEIIARIRQSLFLIADFTGQRNGVYFEAGFMLGLGRPVIWICEKSDLKNIHFDTRQYNTIDYTDIEDLEKRLKYRIEAILGVGPLRKREPIIELI
jgi:nucleoside 2-deoxyribosyltransferase